MLAKEIQTDDLSGFDKVKFLRQLSEKLSSDSNYSEAAKSAETALLIRKRLPSSESSLFSSSLCSDAVELVTWLNARGVELFQRDDYDSALLLLHKGLFLTSDLAATNCFEGAEHDRLRLRAATHNNLGCLAKRQESYDVALEHLGKAAELEHLVDPDTGASPSTHLNLCTILNKLGQHGAAAVAAERAVRHIQFQLQSNTPETLGNRLSSMLALALYNHGVSLEFASGSSDVLAAKMSYEHVLAVARQYSIDMNSAPVVAANRALGRLSIILKSSASNGHGDESRALGSKKRLTPVHLPALPKLPQLPDSARLLQTHIMERAKLSQVNENSKPKTKMESALEKHKHRMQLRTQRKEAVTSKQSGALRAAQLSRKREAKQKHEKEEEQQAMMREQQARTLYEKMEAGLRTERAKNLKDAAKKIQRIWRGYITRSTLRIQLMSCIRIQAVVRSHQCRMHLRRIAEDARERETRAELARIRAFSAIVIQRAARQLIRRLHCIREYRAKLMKRRFCARKIIHTFREFRIRRHNERIAYIAAQRQAEENRVERLNAAAMKIQGMFRAYKSRRFMRIVRREQQRRCGAATKIQALVRGSLTRAWFVHYRMYRRQQELSSSHHVRSICCVQRAWRCFQARRAMRLLATAKNKKGRDMLLFVSSRRIQCCWRRYTAVAMLSSLMTIKRRQLRSGASIQIWWSYIRWRVARAARLSIARRHNSAAIIQRQWQKRLCRMHIRRQVSERKERARLEKRALARTALVMDIQSCLRAKISEYISDSMLCESLKISFIAVSIQRVARGYTARCDVFKTMVAASIIAAKEATRTERNNASRVVQRGVRLFLAKKALDHRRAQRWASFKLQCWWRKMTAVIDYNRRKEQRFHRMQLSAVCCIQRAVRLFLRRRELQRMDVYYSRIRAQKKIQNRRFEASLTIQSCWRGYKTRCVTNMMRAERVRRTVACIIIQRGFRAFAVRIIFARRVKQKSIEAEKRRQAATRIQSFWRRVLAMEYVAVVRLVHFQRTCAAIAIQTNWRRAVALSKFVAERDMRNQQRMWDAEKHEHWTIFSTCVNSFFRSVISQRHVRCVREERMIANVSNRNRLLKMRRTHAAVRIQAIYRGFYERAVARGLRAEAHVLRVIRQKESGRRQMAACRIQRVWKCCLARRQLVTRKWGREQQILAQLMERETTGNPHEIVQQLFWAYDTKVKRSFTLQRRAQHEHKQNASVVIQRIVRGFVARRRFRSLLRDSSVTHAVITIQRWWRRCHARQSAKVLAHRDEAVTKINSVVRMYAARKRWKGELTAAIASKGTDVNLENECDLAATRIQAYWRGHRARVARQELMCRMDMEADDERHSMAASMIQRWYRIRRRASDGAFEFIPRPPGHPRLGARRGRHLL